MILTCPECATRYFVPDESVGDAGRTVRCTSCGAAWHAAPDAPLDLVSSDEEGAFARPSALDLDDGDDLDIVPAATLPGEALPKVYRERVKARERLRRAAVSGAVWGLIAAAFVVMLAAAALFRVDVVKLWPKSASAYAAVGLPVNATGLVIEREQAALEFADGRPALIVRGSIRNVRDAAVQAPPLKVTLLNSEGREVRAQIAEPEGTTVPAGAARSFAISVLDPPASVTDVEIKFVLGRMDRRAEPGLRPADRPDAAHAEVAAPALRGEAAAH